MNMISHAILTLGRFPDERRTLAAEPARWPRALEELLRFVSPVQGLARTTTRDVTLHGITIPAGEQVLLLYGSANHDEDACSRSRRARPRPRRALALDLRPRHPLLPRQRRRAARDPRRAPGAARGDPGLGGRRARRRAEPARADARGRARADPVLSPLAERERASFSGPRISAPVRHSAGPSAASGGQAARQDRQRLLQLGAREGRAEAVVDAAAEGEHAARRGGA